MRPTSCIINNSFFSSIASGSSYVIDSCHLLLGRKGEQMRWWIEAKKPGTFPRSETWHRLSVVTLPGSPSWKGTQGPIQWNPMAAWPLEGSLSEVQQRGPINIQSPPSLIYPESSETKTYCCPFLIMPTHAWVSKFKQNWFKTTCV